MPAKRQTTIPLRASWKGFDLVADLDGIIREIVTLEGVPLVEAGDSVKKGEILVSGQVPILNDAKEVTGYQFRRADARITAEAQIVYHDTAAMSSVEKTYDSVQKRENFLQVGSFRFSFGGIQNNYKNWTFWGYERHLSIGSLDLPVSYGCRLASPYTPRRKTLGLQAVQKILSASFSRYKEDLEKKGVEIIENNVKIYTESQEAAASGKLKVLTPDRRLKACESSGIIGRGKGEEYMGFTETVIEIPAEHQRNVFGQFDVYAKKLERAFRVTLIAREEHVKIMGDAALAEKAKKVLLQLTELSKRGKHDPGTECGLCDLSYHG